MAGKPAEKSAEGHEAGRLGSKKLKAESEKAQSRKARFALRAQPLRIWKADGG
jgi:hypothetical protein